MAWECNCLEEVCGACTMVVNGRVRQACTALVDQLAGGQARGDRAAADDQVPRGPRPGGRPLAAVRVAGEGQGLGAGRQLLDMGPGPRQSQEQQQMAYEYSKCMSCGCCLEACPQFLKIELLKQPGETAGASSARGCTRRYDRAFMGAHAIAQVELFNTNPIGAMNAGERLDALTAEGGIQVCGNAQNCVKVCPKRIPLTTAIGRGGRAATLHSLKKIFDW